MNQVLIEAKIIEVTLENEYRRGIDWFWVNKRLKIEESFLGSAGGSVAGGQGAPLKFTINKKNDQNQDILNTVISALEQFGSTKILSHPRLTIMNNQAGVLKVAQNHVYFQLNYEKNYINDNSNRQEVLVSSNIKTVPLGLVLFVIPSIDMDDKTITLFLRPTITKLSSLVNDPAVNIAIKNSTNGAVSAITDSDQSKIPVTEVREIASILKLHDGEVVVLGGFMEVRSTKHRSGFPGIGSLPIVGEFVSSTRQGDEIVEIVIVIRVQLVNTPTPPRATDIRLQRFVPDPNPF
jgi:general secretion pathway protein D